MPEMHCLGWRGRMSSDEYLVLIIISQENEIQVELESSLQFPVYSAFLLVLVERLRRSLLRLVALLPSPRSAIMIPFLHCRVGFALLHVVRHGLMKTFS